MAGRAAAASNLYTAARRPLASLPSGGGPEPLFLGQMPRSPGIDIARPLPAIVRLMEPAPQRPGADGNALTRGQVVRQQRYRRARGLVATTARVTGQRRRQPPRREPATLPRPTTSRPICERGRLPPCAILPQPAVHAGAVDMAAAGSLGHGLPLGDQQQCLYSAIHTRLTGSLQGCSESLAICTAEPHPAAPIMSLHAPQTACSAIALQDLWRPTY